MTSILQVRLRHTVSSRSEASTYLKSPGDAVLVERGRPRFLLLCCPCGCGEQFPINLDVRAGPAWRLYRVGLGGLSLYPSVWRESGCKSHYIIWRDKILLFGHNEEDFDTVPPQDEITRLIDAVYKQLPPTGLIPFAELAESLNAVPWDVLTACRRLARLGQAWEGKGKQRGSFGRLRNSKGDA